MIEVQIDKTYVTVNRGMQDRFVFLVKEAEEFAEAVMGEPGQLGKYLFTDLAPFTVSEFKVLTDAVDNIYRQRLIDKGYNPEDIEQMMSTIEDHFAFETLSNTGEDPTE